MSDRSIVAGDSYEGTRALYLIALTRLDGTPYDLTGCTVRTTFKPVADDDATDAAAPIKAQIVIDGAGAAASAGLVLGEIVGDAFVPTPASAGKLAHVLTKQQSAAVPVGTALVSDVEVTDAAGRVSTFLFTETLTAVRGITNRSS